MRPHRHAAAVDPVLFSSAALAEKRQGTSSLALGFTLAYNGTLSTQVCREKPPEWILNFGSFIKRETIGVAEVCRNRTSTIS